MEWVRGRCNYIDLAARYQLIHSGIQCIGQTSGSSLIAPLSAYKMFPLCLYYTSGEGVG